MRFSIRLNNDLPSRDYPALARAAEEAGFDQFWVSHDLFLRDSAVILSACATVTSTIRLGTCVLNPYTLHPAEIAMTAATLHEISDGRFNLGLAAGAADFLGWVGIPQQRPLARMRRVITDLRRCLRGEPVDSWEEEGYLRVPVATDIPIYLGATSPRMLQLAGQLADGALPLLFPPEHFATVKPLIEQGRAAGERLVGEFDLAACIWCSVSADGTAAEDVMKDKIAYYGHALSGYLRDRLGLDPASLDAIEDALQRQRDPELARTLVTPEMLRIGVVGDPAALIQRLEGLVAMGAEHLSFGPPLGPDPLAAIELLGSRVLPHFRT